ncbi:YgaP family membrane protein [Polluticoccus soli]|uniref:YgaP family membrane protein n=1 Tax=Polluticoccus soli TaxID=3034150 RepID=UPI0023E2C9C7|nr:DUF2892 domain-containing protein [Flavipsychrobacter sp. JY13-12]
MRDFFRFMAGGAGRWARGIIGFSMLAWGYNYAGGINAPLIIAGLLPLATAVFDLCLLAPLFGYHISGKVIRERLGTAGEPGEA